MFAVMGATGKAGGAVARALLAAERPVRVVIRNPDKGKPWAEHGCEVAVADNTDAVSLAEAFDGVEGAFVMLPLHRMRQAFIDHDALRCGYCTPG